MGHNIQWSPTKNGGGAMKDKDKIDISRFFCWNKNCTEYNKKGQGNIKPAYYDGKDKDILILQCHVCKRKFSENKGTMFFRKQTKKDIIVKALKATSESTGIRATGRIFDINKNTILSWVHQSGTHSEKLEKFFSEFTDT